VFVGVVLLSALSSHTIEGSVTYTSGKVETIMELFTLERLESLYTEFETCRNEFDMRSLLQCVVYDCLVFIDGDGTG